MFVLSVLEAPNTKMNSLCVQTHLAIKLFLILTKLSVGNLYQFRDIYNLMMLISWRLICSCGSMVEHCINSAKVVGSIPRQHTYWQ